MSWKNLALNAFVTLIITIVGGIAVFYFTKSDPEQSKITYGLERIADFRGQEADFSIFRVLVDNQSSQSAQLIEVRISWPSSSVLSDYRITLAGGERPGVNAVPDGDRALIVRTPILGSRETLEVNLAIRGSAGLQPTVFARTADHVIAPTSVNTNRNQNTDNKALTRYVAIGAMTIALITQFLFFSLNRRMRSAVSNMMSIGRIDSLNNAGFVLLHQGAIKDAKRFFETQFRMMAGPIPLANYALAIGFLGEHERAQRYFSAAEWWGRKFHSKHEIAVVLFSLALYQALVGDVNSAQIKLAEAQKLSGRPVADYVRMSRLVADLVVRHPDFLPSELASLYAAGRLRAAAPG